MARHRSSGASEPAAALACRRLRFSSWRHSKVETCCVLRERWSAISLAGMVARPGRGTPSRMIVISFRPSVTRFRRNRTSECPGKKELTQRVRKSSTDFDHFSKKNAECERSELKKRRTLSSRRLSPIHTVTNGTFDVRLPEQWINRYLRFIA